MANTETDLHDLTPVQIDTALSDLYQQETAVLIQIDRTADSIHRLAGSKLDYHRGTWNQSLTAAMELLEVKAVELGGNLARQAQAALRRHAAAIEPLAGVRAQMVPYQVEFKDRGGWARAFLVANPTGHVHSSMACSTCFLATRFVWMVQYSGKPEADIVDAAGARACTLCFSSAPAAALNRPTVMFGPDEITAQERRAARAEAKTARDAAKIAKALTVDGSEFRVSFNGWTERFKTETAAAQWVVGAIADTAWGYTISESQQAAMNTVIAAIATKHQISVEDVTADIARKAVAKRKRDAR